MFDFESIKNLINNYEIDKILIIISSLYVMINSYASMKYSTLCEQTYGIPKLYFNVNFRDKVLETFLQVAFIFICWSLYLFVRKTDMHWILNYILRLLMIEAIFLLLYLTKIFIDLEHKCNYEIITKNKINYIVLSHYIDKVLCVRYHFYKNDSRLLIYTKHYILLKNNNEHLNYKNFSNNCGSNFRVIVVRT